MSDVIKVLPDSVANQIAAGEVIQRPASVIKELVENAVDAGADSITIVLKDSGRTLMQVIDNGTGMSDTDARLAFERHATSKIRKADDLFTLHTMGFRGEALPSIAAIAQLDVRTMLHDATIGTRLIINASKVESQTPEVTAPGTSIMVKNIFFNLPVRRKFLKKDSVELSNIMREFEKLALVNVNVDFTVIHNDVTLHALRRTSLKRRIADLFGKNFDRQLIPIETDTSIVRISGFIGLPENARKRNHLQFMMVNGRNMYHKYFAKAVELCYEHLIAADEKPNYFINLMVDPETIDVNIHPQKHEIKFENEQAIWQILTAAIKDSLGKYNAAPAIDFNVEDAPDIPVFNPDFTADINEDLDSTYNPFNVGRQSNNGGGSAQRGATVRSHISTPAPDWEKFYDEFTRKRDDGFEEIPGGSIKSDEDTVQPSMPELNVETATNSIMQLKDSYILTPSHKGLMVIDQHRAHVRILFERYLGMIDENTFVAQQSMFPEIIQLTPSRNIVMEDILPYLEQLGFTLSPLGGNSWSVLSVPSVMTDSNINDIIDGIITSVEETGEDIATSLSRKVALSLARGNAIRRGRTLPVAEMESLISDLFRTSNPAVTPEGNPVFAVIEMNQITSLF